MSFWHKATEPQRYARLLEVVCAAAFFPLLFFMWFVFVSAIMQEGRDPVTGFSYADILLIFFLGFLLMCFYGGESRGFFTKWLSVAGWTASIVYNVAYLAYLVYFIPDWLGVTATSYAGLSYMLLLMVWPLAAACASGLALYTLLVPVGQRQL